MVVSEKTAARRSVTILGSTGSVGCSTIDLIERNPDRYVVEALTARRNVDLLVKQALALRPRYVAISDETHYTRVEGGIVRHRYRGRSRGRRYSCCCGTTG